MNEVRGVLQDLGYEAIRPAGGDWMELEECDEAYGTTDETHVIWHQDEREIELVDAETGEVIAVARPLEPTPTG